MLPGKPRAVASGFSRKSHPWLPALAGSVSPVRHDCCLVAGVPHPYPRHHPTLPYTGKHHYFLTFCTDQRRTVFANPESVALVLAQFVRARCEYRFELTAYCFMPDHVHLLIRGLDDCSDCKAFITAAKKYSGYYFKQETGRRLWERYGFERVVRDDMEVWSVVCYIIMNPVRAGLVERPCDYPYVGSERYTVADMMEMCSEMNPECQNFRL
jgi:putative transposase